MSGEPSWSHNCMMSLPPALWTVSSARRVRMWIMNNVSLLALWGSNCQIGPSVSITPSPVAQLDGFGRISSELHYSCTASYTPARPPPTPSTLSSIVVLRIFFTSPIFTSFVTLLTKMLSKCPHHMRFHFLCSQFFFIPYLLLKSSLYSFHLSRCLSISNSCPPLVLCHWPLSYSYISAYNELFSWRFPTPTHSLSYRRAPATCPYRSIQISQNYSLNISRICGWQEASSATNFCVLHLYPVIAQWKFNPLDSPSQHIFTSHDHRKWVVETPDI